MPPFNAIRAAIARHKSFYITTHVGPDGDATGPALALKIALESLGKRAVYVSRDGVPGSSRFLSRCDEVELDVAVGERFDCAFVLDCDGTPGRVASRYDPIETASERILIDHHRTSQPIFEVNWLDPLKPATAQMIYELLVALEVPISSEMATGILTGLSCDTGHFRFSNTTPDCLRAAAHLVELGADISLVAFKQFDERSFGSNKLLGVAMTKSQSEHDGELIYTAISSKDFQSQGTGDESSENIVNFLRNVRGARMAICLRERRDETGPHARISVRSEESLRADLFCNEFGGGGHAAAAGCRQSGEFLPIVTKVIRRANQWLDEEHPAVAN